MKRLPITTLPLAFALALFLALSFGASLPALAHPGHGPAGMIMKEGEDRAHSSQGPGMMRHAMKRKGRGGGMMPYLQGMMAKLPQDQRERVRKLRLAMKRQMNIKRAELKNLRLDMREVMRAFPLDKQAALKTQQAMQKTKQEMFALHLDTLAQVQRIVGREVWEEAHSGTMSGHEMGQGSAMGGGGHRQ